VAVLAICWSNNALLDNEKTARMAAQGHGPNLLYEKMSPFPRRSPCFKIKTKNTQNDLLWEHKDAVRTSCTRRYGPFLGDINALLNCNYKNSALIAFGKLEQRSIQLHLPHLCFVFCDLRFAWMAEDHCACTCEQINCQLKFFAN